MVVSYRSTKMPKVAENLIQEHIFPKLRRNELRINYFAFTVCETRCQVNGWNEWRGNLLLLLMIPYPNLNGRNANDGQGELILLPPSHIVMGEVLR